MRFSEIFIKVQPWLSLRVNDREWRKVQRVLEILHLVFHLSLGLRERVREKVQAVRQEERDREREEAKRNPSCTH